MSKVVIILIGIVSAAVIALMCLYLYQTRVTNPRVIENLTTEPRSDRAKIVTLVTLPDGQQVPANYLREGNLVFIGVDGRWWRAFADEGAPITLLIKGEQLKGHARAILDDPGYTSAVFKRLRPNVPKWLPDALNGVLLEVTLE